MAISFRPKRIKRSLAENINMILKKGEILYEIPETGIGTGSGRIKMGDGITPYKDLPYFDTSGGSITIDTELSNTSTNPVQNKVITNELNSKLNNTNPVANGCFVLNPGTHESTEFGDYSSTEGRGCLGRGEASHAEGIATLAQANASHTEGQSTKAEGECSHAEGGATIAAGDFSHAEGNSTTTNNLYEHAEGHFNKSHKTSNVYGDAGNTLHSVGIGTNIQNRKNAIEIMQNGDIYILGIGNYDGVNIDNATPIKDLIDSMQNTINSLQSINNN